MARSSCSAREGVMGEGFVAGALLGTIVNFFLFGRAVRRAGARARPAGAARESMRTVFRADRAYFDQVVAGEPALARCLR
jgi:hypothetical protein